jgi:hypothetical protein
VQVRERVESAAVHVVPKQLNQRINETSYGLVPNFKS